MKTDTKIKVKGKVKIETFKWQGFRQVILERDNAILASAKEIVARRLADIPSSTIDTIKIYNAGLLIASRAIVMKNLISATEIEFSAVFIESDFTGAFNECRLYSEAIGPFSGLTGFSASKPADQQLAVTWKISIIDCV